MDGSTIDGRKEVPIDGVTFELSLLGAKQGRRVLTRIMADLGPALSSLAESGNKDRALTLLGAVCEKLTPDLVDYLCEVFGPVSFVETAPGKRPKVAEVFDVFFRGRYGLMTRWLVQCVSYNFGDFLSDGTSMSSLGLVATPSPSISPRT